MYLAGGTYCTFTGGIGPRTWGAKLLPVGARQGEHFLGNNQETVGGEKGWTQEQRQGDGRCRGEASDGD